MAGLAAIFGETGSDELQFDTDAYAPIGDGATSHFQSEETEYELDGADQFVF